MRSAFRTLLPTLGYHLTRPALLASSKPALFTMNILPPLMTVWHHFARKNLGDTVDITIFDCSGKLDPRQFPGARVQKYLNLYASVKCDEFIRHIARNRKIAWLCDDDIFFISDRSLPILKQEFADPLTASVSFRSRNWWKFTIDGNTYDASGSYCLALNRDIFWKKERLSLAPANGNTHAIIDGKPRRYDTFDRANETLLQKKYRCAVVSQEERDGCVLGFTGMSGAVMLLDYFSKPDDVLAYYGAPDAHAWKGNMLPGTLASMLAIHHIQDCHAELTGTAYPLPSLPSRADLECLRDTHLPSMRPDMSAWFAEVDATGRRLADLL